MPMFAALFLAAQLQTTGSLVVTLRDSVGRPLSGAWVQLLNPTRRVPSDSAGRYRLDSVPAGRVTLIARCVGFRGARDSVTIEPGQERRLNIVLHPAPDLLRTTAPSASPGVQPPSYEAFSLGLFRHVTEHAADSNVFLSPASAAFAVAMTYGGSGGTTQTAMARTLGVEEAPSRLGPENATLLESLGKQPGVELDIANSVWASPGRPFLDSFVQRTEEWYRAPVRTLALNTPAAEQTINDWVSNATKGKIPKLLSQPFSDTTAMVLINAVYFKGAWKNAFDSSLTHAHPFTLANGRVVSRALMNRNTSMQYQRRPGFRGVRLPYTGDRIAMYVFLPDSGAQFDTSWLRGFSETKVHLGLPKFRIEYETTLNAALADMGMEIAFNKLQADFSGMLPRSYLADTNVYISKVVQKTFVDVSERGTEAAAATDVVMGVQPTAAMPSIEMIVDRPFVAAIRDDKTGLLLFLGRITDPVQR